MKIGGEVRQKPDGTPLPMSALPVFGYKSRISIVRRFGFVREAADGRHLVTTDNTSTEF